MPGDDEDEEQIGDSSEVTVAWTAWRKSSFCWSCRSRWSATVMSGAEVEGRDLVGLDRRKFLRELSIERSNNEEPTTPNGQQRFARSKKWRICSSTTCFRHLNPLERFSLHSRRTKAEERIRVEFVVLRFQSSIRKVLVPHLDAISTIWNDLVSLDWLCRQWVRI